ncbi:MAG TPA: bifunctional glycosyltransferase/class I SAM-dependent methyltransferase [Thermoanaerobaculia bacterium]|jgi:2-polyprenyl-3-methyl-5-hydroxy-6-metoxy-1,4-benzoquinol methylase|nr:bifunctional glycosyltransferase/class I SAM-dependent methyltransferase [Thermoanaerobaculia bacterium]
MSSTSVSVLVPLMGPSAELPSTIEVVERYLQTTGFAFDIRVLDRRDGADYGSMIRRGAADAGGSVIIVVDQDLPYPVSAIGDAVALIESGAADVVFGRRAGCRDSIVLRSLLVAILPDPSLHLKAFSAEAARLLIPESKLRGGGFDLETAYLANKYGFRVERLKVLTEAAPAKRTFNFWRGIGAAVSIRMTDRRNGYRAPRRCPVCFSNEVWNFDQIPGNVVRACSRCKCRYLGRFDVDDDRRPVRRVLRAQPAPVEIGEETLHRGVARVKTSQRRLAALRRHVTSRARVLEIGVGDGSFGDAAAREFEYVGIDRAAAAARAARARGLDVYCSTVPNFVNTGPAFEAIVLFHVFENMADPHDALARMKDLLKPGGVLLLSTFDTEGLVYLVTERRWMTQNFRTHLILYSRSALIELLEHSGFEIVSIGAELAYRDHRFLRHSVAMRWPGLTPFVRMLLQALPDPLLVSSGSIRIVAKRRAGSPINFRAIRSVEPTHAR